jgi:acyl-CoA synthetase (AMP-forming)/AMP-acid ligase II
MPTRIVTLGSDGRIERHEDVRFVPKDDAKPRGIAPLSVADPALFARAYADALASDQCPLVINPGLPPKPRASLEGFASSGVTESMLGHLLCTSGTTRSAGVPKVFFFDWPSAVGNARAHLASIEIEPQAKERERFLLPLPIWHSFGVVAGMLGSVAANGELYAFATTPDPSTLQKALVEHEITTLYLNPTLARLLVRAARRRPLPPLPALRRVSIGSASMTRGELIELMELLPKTNFYFTYGLTEMGPRVTTFVAGSAINDHAYADPVLREEPSRSVPIGRPIEGVSCLVADDGRLLVRSMYAATKLREDPFFQTEDAAAHLPRGLLELRGRVDATIISGGLNIYPEDLERVALAVPGIARACAVGVPSDLYGEIVVLLCEAARDAFAGELAAPLAVALSEALPRTHQPKAIRFVDTLPHTAAGKVLREEAKVLAR